MDQRLAAALLISIAWRYRNNKDPVIRQAAREDIRLAIHYLRYGVRPSVHRHQCGHTDDEEYHKTGLCKYDGCGYIWEHDSRKISSDRQNEQEHHCPRCGLGPWYLILRA